MKNLTAVVSMYFLKVFPANIIKGDLDYRVFPRDDFDAISLRELVHMTETETDALYGYLRDFVGTGEGEKRENGLNVFRALKELTKDFLRVREDQPLCRYENLLQWRELTRCLGEDIPVCAFLACRTEQSGYVWEDFEWPAVIGHDNMQLNRIIQRGISDNHFHLFGSAPSFQLIWIHLMNNVMNHRYSKALAEIDQKRRRAHTQYLPGYREEPLADMHFQAALIRSVLFYYVYMCRLGRWEEAEQVAEARGRIEGILTGGISRVFYGGKVQLFLDSMKTINTVLRADDSDDYANLGYHAGSIYHDFEGERAFLYQMLLGYAGGRPLPEFMLNWFYAYLAIQVRFHEELVQVNENTGFENFSNYNSRKKAFLYTEQDNWKMVHHAVKGSMEPGNLKSLEVRISPGEQACENSRWLRECDRCLRECISPDEMNRVYYVYHFPKRQDEKPRVSGSCRHASFRRELEQKADQLIRLRERFPREAARVLGIDACAQEIGCRPEVFGPVFRRLSGHVVKPSLFGSARQWKKTYHVGEDWMDVVDGLWAVDEAVLFLDMGNGDRMGHATVLGIDVRDWYRRKKGSVYLPLQDYLDNVVWLYHRLISLDICSCETLKGFLCSEFERCFKALYQPYMEKDCLQYDIDTYYEAWKLRGDHPVLYRGNRFSNPYYFFREHWVNDALSGGDKIRKRKETVQLMFSYHYLPEIRCEGAKTKAVVIPEIYVDGVEKVQKGMQYFIAERGICVETNPSSN